ncbi:MAG TPA: ATP-dependent DNA ligase [Tepidisphaeraceae bacterium]|nr:ATP-dependent DNA ligase [Tepidisphaeraceae bacterium]
MPLPIKPPYPPMEAKAVDKIPGGEQWQYEPKWDGFRCLAFRDGDHVELQSKAGQPLGRYFPEVVAAIAALKAQKFVLDGEIVVPLAGGELSFDDLLQRIHPAASRITKLSQSHPATFIVFDLLVDERGAALVEHPLSERRPALEALAKKHFGALDGQVRLSPASTDIEQANEWFGTVGGKGSTLDGVMAKRLDCDYRSGERDGMVKIKRMRTAECVVGGFRYGSKATTTLGSLLLGLYDDEGLLHHVGFCSSLTAKQRAELTPKIEKLKKPVAKGGGFTGRAPGGPSRWSTERSGEWEPLDPTLVVEVQYDHFTQGRFRHGTGFLRWRPDKPPKACSMEQVMSGRPSLSILDDGKKPRSRRTAHS